MNAIVFGALLSGGAFAVSAPVAFVIASRRRRKREAAAVKLPSLASSLYGPFSSRRRR